MQLTLSSIIEYFKKHGFSLTVASIAATICLGIVDQFTSRIIPTIAQQIEYLIDPPTFFVHFDSPVDLSPGLKISALSAQTIVDVKYNAINDRFIAALAGSGAYTLTLRRTHNQAAQELVSARAIKQSGEIWPIDTSERNWADAKELTTAKGLTTGSGTTIPLAKTRWSATEPDFAIAATVEDPVMRSMLANALAEVGVYENGSDREKSRVLSYWKAIPDFQATTDIRLPWSGAFMGWITNQAGVEPPQGAAANINWKNWGDEVVPASLTSGMVAVFSPKGSPGLSGLVGVVLRRQPNCIEVLMGNVADRVVITCIAEDRLISVRRPSFPDRQSAESKPAPQGE